MQQVPRWRLWPGTWGLPPSHLEGHLGELECLADPERSLPLVPIHGSCRQACPKHCTGLGTPLPGALGSPAPGRRTLRLLHRCAESPLGWAHSPSNRSHCPASSTCLSCLHAQHCLCPAGRHSRVLLAGTPSPACRPGLGQMAPGHGRAGVTRQHSREQSQPSRTGIATLTASGTPPAP